MDTACSCSLFPKHWKVGTSQSFWWCNQCFRSSFYAPGTKADRGKMPKCGAFSEVTKHPKWVLTCYQARLDWVTGKLPGADPAEALQLRAWEQVNTTLLQGAQNAVAQASAQ